MKYEIEIVETVSRTKTYTIEVEDEGEGIMISHMLEDYIDDAYHPDDIPDAFKKVGVEIVGICIGAEEVEYEIL